MLEETKKTINSAASAEKIFYASSFDTGMVVFFVFFMHERRN